MWDEVRIAAAQYRQDSTEPLGELGEVLEACKKQNLRVLHLTIDPLRAGWDTPKEPTHFRSGCAPILALALGSSVIQTEEYDAVAIMGEDLLRTQYTSAERAQFTKIFDVTIPEAYDRLATEFAAQHNLDDGQLEELFAAVFRNCERSFGIPGQIQGKWSEKITRHFRGIDCANPVIDFKGGLVISHVKHIDKITTSKLKDIYIAGLGLGYAENDGPEASETLATYQHLQEALKQAERTSGLCIKDLVLNNSVLLEAYSCYPIVPLGFLQAASFTVAEFKEVLSKVPLTVSGGLNLARAPWNNPALRGLIDVARKMTENGFHSHGIVHGNGGLGQKQGIAILGKAPAL